MSNVLVTILHAHIPYVLGHGAWPHGEDWLNESVGESYLPLLRLFNELAGKGCAPKVTLVVTPILAEQLRDGRFKEGFKEYVDNKIDAAEEDESEFTAQGETGLAALARMWRERYEQLLHEFSDVYGEDIVAALRSLEEQGAIELMTCAATHAYLPLLGEDGAVRAQVKLAVESHKRYFGTAPRGFWLPECAYRPRQEWTYPIEGWGPPRVRPGIEKFLADEGIRHFVVDSHLTSGGEPVTVYHMRFGEPADGAAAKIKPAVWRSKGAVHSPYDVYYVSSDDRESRIAFFTRDPKTGIQVWSGTVGYPGDENYLEFHKKRFPGGHRYWRVTDRNSDLDAKLEYVPEDARAKTLEHAEHFVNLVSETLRQPGANVLAAPYDAELYGHWWFEGTDWLAEVLRLAHNSPDIELMTASEFLDSHKPVDVVPLPEGSWGRGGEHGVWYNRETRWSWVRLYDAEEKMKEMAHAASTREDAGLDRVLKQMARELLLLESSDWQFNITTWSARDYAEKRAEEHYSAFRKLHEIAYRSCQTGEFSSQDAATLRRFEETDPPFDTVDPQWWV